MEERREVSEAELASERQAGLPLLHVVAQSSTFPLLELDDHGFERLARDLLDAKANPQSGYDRVTLMRRGADRGRDILLYSGGRLTGIVQCKRKAAAIGLPEIRSELLKYCLFAVRDPSIAPRGHDARYQLWTAHHLTEEAKQFFDDADVRARALRDISLDEALRVRSTLKSLTKADPEDDDRNGEEAPREASAAIRLAQRLTISHVGPSDIYSMLHQEDIVRRVYFRSPLDGPPRANVDEISALLQARRRGDLTHFREAGALDGPYVARPSIEQAFDDFMTEASRLFVLVGGSGQGKTSWAAHLIACPPEHWSAHMVRAEDIAEADQHLIETLKRDLEARPVGHISTQGLMQAVWDWADSGNHIVVIDGLDRVRSATRDALPGWLRRSEELTRKCAIRLVLTSRRESWAAISNGLLWKPPHLHSTIEGGASLDLGALSPGEAGLLYEAYGVSSGQHSGRPLDSPSLIHRFAGLKGDERRDAATRHDVLSADFAAMLAEIGKAPGVTKVAAEIVMSSFGELLLDHTDGWVPATKLATTIPGAPAVLEALIRGDRAIMRDDKIRLESDDMIEQVIGRRLKPEDAIELLRRKRDEPVVIGGIAAMLARTEARSVEEARELLDAWLAAAPTGQSAALDAVARSLLEVRAPEAFIAQASAAVGRWQEMNLILGLSQLGDMIASIALPAAVRLELMWPLVANEDPDDWRTKYWFDPALGGRIVTSFATAAEQAAGESGSDVLAFLIERIRDSDEHSSAVARYLLHIAATAAPEQAVALGWDAPRVGFETAFDLATSSVPGAAARFLGTEQASSAPLQERVRRIYELAWREPLGHVRPAVPGDIVSTVERLLPLAGDPELEVRLLIAALRFQPDDGLRPRLIEHWSHVETGDYNRAISVLPDDEQERLLVTLISGDDTAHDRSYLIGNLWSLRLEPSVRHRVILELSDLYSNEPGLAKPIASAVEGMLYEVSTKDDSDMQLERLALRIADAPDDRARATLIYYAGSPQRGKPDATDLARRERILTALVAAETGANLGTLMWKIAESAHERPDAAGHAMHLIERHGAAEVFEALRPYRLVPGAQDLRDQIDLRLAERPKPVPDDDVDNETDETDKENAGTPAPETDDTDADDGPKEN